MTIEQQQNGSQQLPEKCLTCPLVINAQLGEQAQIEVGNYGGAKVWESVSKYTIESCMVGEPTVTESLKFRYFGTVMVKTECSSEGLRGVQPKFYSTKTPKPTA